MDSAGTEPINLGDYVSAGYYLARLREAGTERPPSKHLPAKYISGSKCLCDFFTDSWVWDNAGPMDSEGNFIKGIRGFQERLVHAALFGIKPERLTDLIRWGQLRCGRDFGFPYGYHRLVDARRATDWTSLPPEKVALFALGLHRSLTDKFLKEMAEYEDFTAALCVKEGLPLSSEGIPLGHELLNLECGHPAHSWICSGAEADFIEKKQLSLNTNGYIHDFPTATECARILQSGEIPGEPGPWFPWLIVSYS